MVRWGSGGGGSCQPSWQVGEVRGEPRQNGGRVRVWVKEWEGVWVTQL